MSPAPTKRNSLLASMLYGPPAGMLAAHKPKYAFRNYPLNIRPMRGQRFMEWKFLSVVAAGEFVLFVFTVPTGCVGVINRFASIGSGIVSFTLSIDGIDDPVIDEVGHFRGIPPTYDVHEKQVFWPYREYFLYGVMGHVLIDPVLADEGQEVKLRGFNYSLTGAAEFAGGVSGFFCERPEKWSMGR